MPTVVYRKKTGEVIRITYNPKVDERKAIDRRIYDVTTIEGPIPKNARDYCVINGRFKERGKEELNLRRKVSLQRKVLELQKDFKEAKKQKLDELADQIATDITALKKQIAQLGAE